MRLINTSTFEVEFFLSKIPRYAILSHTWGDEEVTFQDISTPEAKYMQGFKKIELCCAQARRDKLKYAWVDTCCIDKTSSAELTESINSMYAWYRDAAVCYAYLADVLHSDNPHSALAKSKWFTRGWTLQELLAPASVVFYSAEWVELGTKSSLEESITEITGIAAEHLGEGRPDCAVAVKMSWAAYRDTTRVEDKAYCLLGIFGVTMAPIYGEGMNAFQRLQLEILKSTHDHTMFVHGSRGPLAPSPSAFCRAGSMVKCTDLDYPPSPYSMTNNGLHIELPIIGTGSTCHAILSCRDSTQKRQTMIKLERVEGNVYIPWVTDLPRIIPGPTDEEISTARRQFIYIRDGTYRKAIADSPPIHYDMVFRELPTLEVDGCELQRVDPDAVHAFDKEMTISSTWTEYSCYAVMGGYMSYSVPSTLEAILYFGKGKETLFLVEIKVGPRYRWCNVVSGSELKGPKRNPQEIGKNSKSNWQDRCTKRVSRRMVVSAALREAGTLSPDIYISVNWES